jgi:shikimate dehydrogenase
MGLYGLLGRTLGHSYSPQIHAALGCPPPYMLYEKETEELPDLFAAPEFDGINVTIPHKKAVIPFLDELSDAARAIGSVNTIVRRADGTLFGDNTDYYGFDETLRVSGIDPSGKKALVLGDGGAAPTVRAVLRGRGAKEVVTISRRGENNYENLDRHRDAALIVNATPVGMYPNVGEALVDLSQFPNLVGVLDLIYNPARTKLLLDAERLGIPHSNGLYMLVAQAKRAEELFQNRTIDDRENDRICAQMRAQMQNIALIGMPGVGKSSCGAALAALTGRTVVDLDHELEHEAGMSIPSYFAAYGEAQFRELETKVLAEWSKKSGLILATGGGVVTRPENYPLLHQNSTIFFLRREIAQLSTDGRPLSQSKGTAQLAAERLPLYTAWADHIIDCVNPAANAQKIMEVLNA